MKRILMVIGCAGFLAACGTTPTERALSGGAIGAGTGAVVGGLATGTGGGAVAGAVIGGVGGAAIGAGTAPRRRYR